MAGNRLVGISIEWTDEQKKLISQISKEITGCVIGVSTPAKKVDHEYVGAEGSEADKKFVNLLYETNVDLIGRVEQNPVVKQDIEARIAARNFGPAISLRDLSAKAGGPKGGIVVQKPAQGSIKLAPEYTRPQELNFAGMFGAAMAW